MSSYMKNDNEPELDPYNVLGVPPTASDADINKAFKKLALKLHPDKQQQQQQQQHEGKKIKKSSSTTREQAEEAFHQVQWAKSFLLDAEFAEQRRKYDTKRVSLQARRVAEETRTAAMSDKRRRMRDELQRQEQQASHHLKKRNAFAAPAHGNSSRSQVVEEEAQRETKQGKKKSSSASSKTKTAEDNARLERLRRQGNEMREAYADRQEQNAAAKSRTSRREREQQYDYVQEDEDEQRQVRLKWSRKKMASSSVLTELSLMQILKQRGFGEIERVEMLGNKGNAALVTFVSADSCRPCVDALIDSEEMRATYVGKRKEQEELNDKAAEKKKREHGPSQSSSSTVNRDTESVADWKLRRAAEREELLRQVERDEDVAATTTKTPANNSNHSKGQKRKSTAVFPPLLPKRSSVDQVELSPFELLQRAEIDILEKNGILSSQEIQAFQSKVL